MVIYKLVFLAYVYISNLLSEIKTLDYSGTVNGFDDDIDDIMASIMQSRSSQVEPYAPPNPTSYSKPVQQSKQRSRQARLDLTGMSVTPKKKPTSFLDLSQHTSQTPRPQQPLAQKQATRRPVGLSAETTFNLPLQYYRPDAEEPNYYDSQAVEDAPKSNLLKVSLISFAVFTVTIIGGAFLWHGPISNALKPKSPFSAELSQKTGLPLFFPAKLPGSFKMETNSIAQPDPSVVVYVISDNHNKKLNISLQKPPANLDLSQLYGNYSNVKELDTKFGKVKVGTSEEGMDIANVLAGQTWIIITSEEGSVSASDLQSVINGLEI